MSGRGFRFAAVFCLLVCLSGESSANSAQPTLPPDPSDPYYQTFKTIPPAEDTAMKLIINFLARHSPFLRRFRFIEDVMVDVVVVMDGSGSIGSCEFSKGKKALKYLLGLERWSRRDAKYAAVTFGSSATANFQFLPYSTAATEIINITYPGGLTNTQAGLAEAKRVFDDSSSGRRVSSRKRVFLVTDGQSNVQKQLTIPNAQALKNTGVEIFVVAVGTHINGIDEMVKMASYPPEDFVFRVENLRGFWKVVKLAIKRLFPGKYNIVEGQYDPPC